MMSARSLAPAYLFFTLLAMFCSSVLGCAEGTPLESDVAHLDVGSPHEDVVDAHDPPTEDTGLDDVHVVPDVPDVEPDTRCTVCCPGDTHCVSEATLSVCDDQGLAFEEVDCGETQMCQDGACVDRPVCEVGETRCHDAHTLLTCRASRTGFASQECGPDETCLQGQCVQGTANGRACSSDTDCAGGKCFCGDDETCPASVTPSYCTATCSTIPCNPDEWCLDSSMFTGNFGYDHCVRKCDTTCSIDGLMCKHVPVKHEDEVTWGQGCFPQGLSTVGEECTSDADCLAGTCLLDYFDTGYCTRRCETTGCPSNAACVELRTGSGEYWCSLLCNGGASGTRCPLDPNEQRFDVDCTRRAIHGDNAGTARVCTSTRSN